MAQRWIFPIAFLSQSQNVKSFVNLQEDKNSRGENNKTSWTQIDCKNRVQNAEKRQKMTKTLDESKKNAK